jgi:hypothetical protein
VALAAAAVMVAEGEPPGLGDLAEADRRRGRRGGGEEGREEEREAAAEQN